MLYANVKEILESIKDCRISEDYEIIDFFKKGSVGKVCKGKFKKVLSTKFVALKFLISKKNKDKENHSEVLIHSKLKHKNIPDIFGYYQVKNGSCIAMELSDFGDLSNFKRKILKKSYFSETLICFLSFQILDAIFYLHTNYKIIHLDIKQQNVLIDQYLKVKLSDFSVSLDYKEAKEYIDLEREGTSHYISLEVLEEKRIEVEEASKIDIYSFGVLLYVLAFCDFPYELINVKDRDYEQIAKNIREKELTFPKNKNHSELFINFLRKCLEKDIKKRYNIYDAKRDPWVRGYKFLLDEKEKLYNQSKFLIQMMINNITAAPPLDSRLCSRNMNGAIEAPESLRNKSSLTSVGRFADAMRNLLSFNSSRCHAQETHLRYAALYVSGESPPHSRVCRQR